ncbi:acyl-CoA synthetase [Nocardioides plantarum]|uniref:Acyl-CoA synthetase n=1 Tax=Nocardioides plantarum TaxID=29299 RepID=A0ABV5KD11_9ACTN|nr:acyl-CoA synthetase [Nocardioides plantarum]
MADQRGFTLSSVFRAVARAVPEQEVMVWRDRRLTYAALDARVDGLAHFLVAAGLGCHTERDALAGHESGQDHVGIYLRNGNEYLETMIAGYRARVAPFNVNYRYVEEELLYLLTDAGARALVYHAEFAPQVAAIRDRLPQLEVLVQVADGSGNALLPGAVDYEEALRTPAPTDGMPTPSGDDLYIVYTGGTTGTPKGVLWRQHDIYVSSMGGTPFGTTDPFQSYEAIAAHAASGNGRMNILMIPPFMHGAAQWSTFHMITGGGLIAIPSDVHRFDAADALRVAVAERCVSIPVVGDAVALPLVEEVETGRYDLSGLGAINNGAAPLSPSTRERILTALPHILIMDAAGSSETGLQMSSMSLKGAEVEAARFTPQSDTAVLSDDLTRPLAPGETGGWLARRDRVPLGYLGDADKTARTFPVIDGVRWSVPGDRADLLEDGSVRLLGRESVTINSGGEKIFAEEVERAMMSHRAVRDVVVAGRPSERWGAEVVAVVALEEGADVTDDELVAAAAEHVARYKLPKAVVRVPVVQRSPSGKADYGWAKTMVAS